MKHSNIGFIGAGKVGCSLGKYFLMNHLEVVGYFSRNPVSAKEAALFTKTKEFQSLEQVVEDCDIVFITVSDREIESVCNSIKALSVNINEKIFCHCSGSISSNIFSELNQMGAFGYSIHPLFAIHDKFTAYKELNQAYFAIDGHEQYMEDLKGMIQKLGNHVISILPEIKSKYHCAAVMASNLMIGLVAESQDLLVECGFNKEEALHALMPLMEYNLNNIKETGLENALTGPIERNDYLTIEKHLNVLNQKQKKIYSSLSDKVLEVAKSKHKLTDYSNIENLIN